MKLNNIAVCALMSVFSGMLLTGCDDFIDLKPKGKEIPTKLEHFSGLMNNTMFSNLSIVEQRPDGSSAPGSEPFYMMYMGDELIADETSYAAMDRLALNAFRYEADIFNAEDRSAEWNAAYQQIYSYNVIVNGVMDSDGGTTEEKTKIQSEARVGRAYLHFLLAQFFSKPYNEATAATDLCVPIVTKATSSERNFTRATVKEVYDFVVSELEEACPLLEPRTMHRQRIYRAAGYYMLGKVYWMMGKYDKALTALNTALTATGNSTVIMGLMDYNTKLTDWGYSPFMAALWGLTGSYPNNFDDSNTEVICNKQFNTMLITFAIFPPTVYVKPEFMELYQASDLRRAFFCNMSYSGQIYPYNKRIQHMVYTLAGDMPDLYLMLAECKARTNDLEGAKADLLTLRRNRMPEADAAVPADVDSRDELIKFTVDERKREYMMTGIRWFDMRRLWNDPLFQDDKKNYTHTNGSETFTLTESRLTFRIPPQVMSFSNGWKDND